MRCASLHNGCGLFHRFLINRTALRQVLLSEMAASERSRLVLHWPYLEMPIPTADPADLKGTSRRECRLAIPKDADQFPGFMLRSSESCLSLSSLSLANGYKTPVLLLRPGHSSLIRRRLGYSQHCECCSTFRRSEADGW